MQTTKLKPLLCSVPIHKEFIRTAAVSSNAVKCDTKLKSWREIPGPSSLPIIGPLLHFLPGGMLYEVQKTGNNMTLYHLYGPIVRLDGMFGKPPLIILRDPEAVAHILRSENLMPVRPNLPSLIYYNKVYKKRQGYDTRISGLITDQGEVWREFRTIVNPILLQPKTIKLYSTVLDEVAQDMIKRLKYKRNDKNMITGELDKEMNLWALESVGTVALGTRLNCLDPNLSPNSPAWELIHCVRALFVTANDLDNKPNLWRYFSTPKFKKAMKLYERLDKLRNTFIEKGKQELKNQPNREKAVLEKLLDINEEIAKIMASDMLIAGVDTAANSMIGILYLLAKNPDKQEKLREEILSSPDHRPYLRACIKEALRLMPVISGNVRLTTKEYNLLGYKIPKNMEVAFAHRDMSTMENNFLKAKEYIPERWITNKDDQLHYSNAHPFAYGPFGYGARACVGRRIAELEMEKFLARIMENFRVEWFGPPPKSVQQNIMYIKGPYNFVFNDL